MCVINSLVIIAKKDMSCMPQQADGESVNTPQISLFEMTERLLDDSVQPIQCSKMTLVHISHTLEDVVLTNRIPAMMFTGFQESSHWQKETERYQELATTAQQICIFAGKPLPDDQPSDVIQIELAGDDPLRQEWFVIILSDHFNVLLTGQDHIAPGEVAINDMWRTFDTILSFDSNIINTVLDELDVVIARYRPDLHDELRQSRQRFAPLRNESSYLSGVVTEMVRFEEQLNQMLRREQTLKQKIVDTMQAYTVTISLDGTITSANPALAQLQAGTIDDLIDEDFIASCLTDDSAPQAKRAFEQVIQTGNVYRFTSTLRCIDPDETSTVVDWTVSVLHMQAEERRLLLLGHDVTERMMVEQLRQDEAVLRAALEKERELARVREKFITTVSHEFRTPLTGILNAAEMLERHYDALGTEGRERRFNQIKKQVRLITGMVNEISTVSEVGNQSVSLTLAPHAIVQTTRDIVRTIGIKMNAENRVRLKLRNVDEQKLEADVRVLQLILSNIISNALIYSSSDREVIVTFDITDNALIYSVMDEGIGIPLADRPHIFEPFYRGSNAGNIPGTGIGLYIVRNCVDVYSGRISYRTDKSGTRFVVRLPLNPSQDDA